MPSPPEAVLARAGAGLTLAASGLSLPCQGRVQKGLMQMRLLGLTLLLLTLPLCPLNAAPPAPARAISAAPAPLPDYGGRDAPVVPTDAGSAMPDPLAQTGRALEALVIVLAGVFGVLYLLKRAGLTGVLPGAAPAFLSRPGSWFSAKAPPPAPAAPAVSVAGSPFALNVVQSQSLPGVPGVTLHLLSVNEETLLLLGATPQGVSLLAQWDDDGRKPGVEETRGEKAAFDDYLQRAGLAPEPVPARSVEARIGATADRLQSLLARSRTQAPDETRR